MASSANCDPCTQTGKLKIPERKAHDLGGMYVLVSGDLRLLRLEGMLTLPPELSELAVGGGHKCVSFSDGVKAEFMAVGGRVEILHPCAADPLAGKRQVLEAQLSCGTR